MARGDRTQLTTIVASARSITIRGDGSVEVYLPVTGGKDIRYFAPSLATIWNASDRAALVAQLLKAEDAALVADGRSLV